MKFPSAKIWQFLQAPFAPQNLWTGLVHWALIFALGILGGVAVGLLANLRFFHVILAIIGLTFLWTYIVVAFQQRVQRLSRTLSSGAAVRPGAVVAPPMPASRAGYTQQGPGVTETIRIYGRGEPTLLTDFPKTMNACGQSLHLVRWRSLGGPIVAGMTAKIPGFDAPIRREDLDPVQEAEAGLLEGTQCDEPAFLLPAWRNPNSLVDVVVEYEVWPASP